MTCTCDIIYYSIFENAFNCNIIMLQCEACFENSEVLNDFISDISKSRNSDFSSRKMERGGPLHEEGVAILWRVGTMEDTMYISAMAEVAGLPLQHYQCVSKIEN